MWRVTKSLTMPQNYQHGIFGILPPELLRNLAKNGTQQQKDFALQTLSIDPTIRTARTEFQLLENRNGDQAHKSVLTADTPQLNRTIFDDAHAQTPQGAVVRSEGQAAVADIEVNEAYEGLGKTYQFYLDVYGRNSIDNAGLPLKAYVHYGVNYQNAFWDGAEMIFGDGDGQIFNRFTIALDVIGHELTHGVTGSEVNLVYSNQSGALNESISDVFGSLVKQYSNKQTAAQADWLIGAGLFTANVQGTNGQPAALRSMKAPGTAYNDPVIGVDPQPKDMKGYVVTNQDNGGVHTNSGIPNHAFYLAAIQISGNAWEKAGQIWYDTIQDKQLLPTATFKQFAQRTVINAGHRFGNNSAEENAVKNAWKQVGVLK